MDVVDVRKAQFREVEIKGHYGVFTELRVDKSTIPDGVNCYELRHGDDDSYPAELQQSVFVNCFGAVLMTDQMELNQTGAVSLSYEDFAYTGEELSLVEYLANYGEEPEHISLSAELVQFMDENDMLFHMSEQEADMLLGYLEGHGYVLGQKDGTLFQGDLNDIPWKTKWETCCIDNAIDAACDWNYSMILETQSKMENAEDFIAYEHYHSRLDELREDEKMLDSMFDRTTYGKQLDEMAMKLATEFIQEMNRKGGIDEAVKHMVEKITDKQDVGVVQEITQNKGRAR